MEKSKRRNEHGYAHGKRGRLVKNRIGAVEKSMRKMLWNNLIKGYK